MSSRNGRASLLGDPRLFAEFDFAFEQLQHLEHDRWRQAPFGFGSGAGAALGHLDQILGPTIKGIAPVFRLRNRQPVLLAKLISQLPDPGCHVLLAHVIQHTLEAHESAALKIGIHVVHDVRGFLTANRFDLSQF